MKTEESEAIQRKPLSKFESIQKTTVKRSRETYDTTAIYYSLIQ